MAYHDDLDGIASADEMRSTPDQQRFARYLHAVDAILAQFAPDGYDASLDGPEWVIVRKAYANQMTAEHLGHTLVQLRGLGGIASESPVSFGNSDLEVALKLSNRLATFARQIRDVQAHTDRIANFMQGQPTREDYDALLADHARVCERVSALESVLSLKAVA